MLRGKKSAQISLVFGLILLLFTAALPQPSLDQQRELEEIVISFEVPKLVYEDVFVQYDGKTVYLPLVEVFSLLDINITADMENKKFSGFFISRKNKYELDLVNLRIKVLGRDYPFLASDYYLGANDLYIRVDLYRELFGLNMTFDFSLLRVFLPLDEEFPAYQRLKRKAAREKLERQIETAKDVVRLPHRREYISGAVTDWMLSTNPLGGRNRHYYNLNTGGMLLGGDFNVVTGGSNEEIFNPDQFNYRWHYYFENSRYLTQAELGNVNAGGPLGRGLNGGMITNRPQVRRQYFQTIHLSDSLGEGWEVELYIGNQLTDYAITDQSGTYSFTTDILYGSSNIELKMYGPNGEIRTEEKIIRAPYTLIPSNELDYTISAGSATINQQERTYLQANSYYGIFNRLTMGVNVDFPLGADDGEKALTAIDATCLVMGNLMLNGSFAPDYAAKGRLSFSRPTLVNISAEYARFYQNKFRNPLDRVYNLVFSISSPARIGGRYLGLRYYVSVDKYPSLVSTNMNYGFGVSVYPVHLTYIGRHKNSRFMNRTLKSTASQVLVSTRYPRFIHPQFRMDYDHTSRAITRYGVYVVKRLFRTGQITLSYERNVVAKSDLAMVTVNVFTSFAGFASRLLRSGGHVSMNQIQTGSIRYDRDAHSIQFDRRTGVGLGSAVIRPFLDSNYNGVMDDEEQYLPGLQARMKGGRARLDKKARQYYYDGLRPYDTYNVRIDQYSLDDPLLRPSYENYQVTISPNVVTAIEVPIVTASEVSGHVARRLPHGEVGIGGIKVVFMNMSKETLIELTTFNNGDYYYLGLLPGSYKAYIDPGQLAKYGYASQPEYISFKVEPVEGGAAIEDINFLLIPRGDLSTESQR